MNDNHEEFVSGADMPGTGSEKDVISNLVLTKVVAKLQRSKSGIKQKSIDKESLKKNFACAQTIKLYFTREELKICIDVLRESLSIQCHYAINWKKDALVDLEEKIVTRPSETQIEQQLARTRKKGILSLKTLCFRTISKLPKSILNCIYGEHVFSMKYLEWRQKSLLAPCTTIEDMVTCMNITWYSNPEFTEERLMSAEQECILSMNQLNGGRVYMYPSQKSDFITLK